jgi:hypothetical protein
MMIHSLAARALLMMADFRCDSTEAILWVCHRLPGNMQNYYRRSLVRMLAVELFHGAC